MTEPDWRALSSADGCGCYFSDESRCDEEHYLYSDTLDMAPGFEIHHIYSKINGQIERFKYKSMGFTIRFFGIADVFDLHFNHMPIEQDIKNAIINLPRFKGQIIKNDTNQSKKWIISDEEFYQSEGINAHHIFETDDYLLRLYEYKRGHDIESIFSKGEVFIYRKTEEYFIFRAFFTLGCGC